MTANPIGFWAWAQQEQDRPALISGDGSTITYGELFHQANRVANGLRAMGLKRGDGVAMLMPNIPEFYEIVLAATQIGLYFTPINNYLAAPEIAYVLTDSDAKALFVHDSFDSVASKAIEQANYPAQNCLGLGAGAKLQSYEAFKAAQSVALPHDRSPGAPMIYTSGTTGYPKGVKRPQAPGEPPESEKVNGAMTALALGWRPGQGVYLLNGPLHHSAPVMYSVVSLHLGYSVVITDKWDAEAALKIIETHKVTNTFMVPIHFHRLLNLPSEVRSNYDLSSLRSVVHSAAPCPVPVKKAILDWFGPVLVELYGGTESSGTMVTSEEWLARPGTVGRPSPGIEIKILKDDESEALAGEVGSVYLKAKTGLPEYFKDEQKTLSARRGDYFTLGDMGYLDKDGWLFLVDRKADMVVSGGANIYPAEIEAVLVQHPKIRDAAVFGIPNEEWGEELKAVLELNPGLEPNEALTDEIRAFCAERLAKYKLPRTIDYSAELPRGPNGKLYKRDLRAPYWAGRERKI